MATVGLTAASSVGSGTGALVAGGSLAWLWQTIAATCCWAISDVICDSCIGQNHAPESNKDGADNSIAVQRVKAKNRTDENVKHRRRKRPNSLSPINSEPTSDSGGSTVNGDVLQAEAMVGSPTNHGKRIMPFTGNNVKVGSTPKNQTSIRQQLTPEQNALVSGAVSLVTAASAVWLGWGFAPEHAVEPAKGSPWSVDRALVLAAIGGCVHFMAYLCTLRAFGSASSTVITPLMQLSAVWMLPFSTLAALLGFSSFIRPVHLLSVMLICAGGFLPAAGGALSSLATSKFWQQKAVRYVVVGELLLCCYNIILHQATFVLGGAESATEKSDAGASVGAGTIRFFLVSRVANGLTCVLLFAVVPSLRQHAATLGRVGANFFGVALVGECLSMFGVCLVTFSYSSFYEPSVVNAVEGGLQQLFNLLFAVISKRVLGYGKDVEQVSTKIVSFVLVAAGLTLSTA